MRYMEDSLIEKVLKDFPHINPHKVEDKNDLAQMILIAGRLNPKIKDSIEGHSKRKFNDLLKDTYKKVNRVVQQNLASEYQTCNDLNSQKVKDYRDMEVRIGASKVNGDIRVVFYLAKNNVTIAYLEMNSVNRDGVNVDIVEKCYTAKGYRGRGYMSYLLDLASFNLVKVNIINGNIVVEVIERNRPIYHIRELFSSPSYMKWFKKYYVTLVETFPFNLLNEFKIMDNLIDLNIRIESWNECFPL